MKCDTSTLTKVFLHAYMQCTCMSTRYCIRGIIGESNIWQFPLKMQLAKFLFGDFEYCMERTHACSLNGVHLIWRYIHDSPNHQIKATAKYTTYTVYAQECCGGNVTELMNQLSDHESLNLCKH